MSISTVADRYRRWVEGRVSVPLTHPEYSIRLAGLMAAQLLLLADHVPEVEYWMERRMGEAFPWTYEEEREP